MKKTILTICILYCGTIFSQKLSVTPEGLKNSEELEKNYVVIQMENKTSNRVELQN